MDNTPLDGAKLLGEYFEDISIVKITFQRDDNDSYIYDILGDTNQDKSFWTQLLPVGSEWRSALGWRCFSGVPLAINGVKYICLSVESVLSHPTRGAFPEYYGYVLTLDNNAISRLVKFGKVLSPGIRGPFYDPRGVLNTDSTTPEMHRRIEAQIIQSMASHYKKGVYAMYCTTILSDTQLKAIMTMPMNVNSGAFCEDFFIGTVPHILQNFSRKSKIWLSLNAHVI